MMRLIDIFPVKQMIHTLGLLFFLKGHFGREEKCEIQYENSGYSFYLLSNRRDELLLVSPQTVLIGRGCSVNRDFMLEEANARDKQSCCEHHHVAVTLQGGKVPFLFLNMELLCEGSDWEHTAFGKSVCLSKCRCG